MASGNQLRIVAGAAGMRVVGYDMTAVLAVAQAMGLHPWLTMELLPAIEAVAVRQINKGMRDGG